LGNAFFLPQNRKLSFIKGRNKDPVPAPTNLNLNDFDAVEQFLPFVINNVTTSVKPNFSLFTDVTRDTVENADAFVNAIETEIDWNDDITAILEKNEAIWNIHMRTASAAFEMINENPLIMVTSTMKTPTKGDNNIESVDMCGVSDHMAEQILDMAQGVPRIDPMDYKEGDQCNHPLFKLTRALAAAAGPYMINLQECFNCQIVCQTKTQAWLMSVVNGIHVRYKIDDGFNHLTAKDKKGKKPNSFKLLEQPGVIDPYVGGSYVYYCDGVDIEDVEEDYSLDYCHGYFYPALDIKVAMADANDVNVMRFANFPEINMMGLAEFVVLDYNGIRDKFTMRLTDSWSYSVSYKEAFDNMPTKIWSVWRQEQGVMAGYRLNMRTKIYKLDDCVPFNAAFYVTPKSIIKLCPAEAYVPGPVYDIDCNGIYLMKCIVVNKRITITCFGPETNFIRGNVDVHDMEIWYMAKSVPSGISCYIEIIAGFTSNKTVMPGYRNLCLDGLTLIKKFPHFCYKDYELVAQGDQPKLSVNCSVIYSILGTDHFSFPVSMVEGDSPTGLIAIPRFVGKAWNNFYEIICPNFAFKKYEFDPTPIVTVRCILKDAKGATDILSLMCADGFLKCNASFILARPGAFSHIFVFSDPGNALANTNLPIVTDESCFESLFKI